MKKTVLALILALILASCGPSLLEKQEKYSKCRGLDGAAYSECMETE